MVTEHRPKNDDDEVKDPTNDNDDELEEEKKYIWGDTKVIFADEELIDNTNEFVNEALVRNLLIILP